MNILETVRAYPKIIALGCALVISFSVDSAHAGSACGGAAGSLEGLPCETAPSDLTNPSAGPNALKTTSEMCDANFMNQIYAKAFLEAEREVVVANTAILRPDSVLEYACPDQNMALVAEDAGPIFSESDRWDPDNIDVVGDTVNISVFMGDTRLDSHIENMTLSTMVTYANSQFPHDFLGGAASGDDHNLSGSVSGVAGTCDHMFNIQFIAKCEDHGLNPPFLAFESFFSTPALEAMDPRALPNVCPATHQITTALIDVAKNVDWTFSPIDQIDPLHNIVRDADYSASCENSDPIPTGIIVYYKDLGQDPAGNPVVNAQYEYEDKFCSNPGCHFDHQGNASPGDDTCEVNP